MAKTPKLTDLEDNASAPAGEAPPPAIPPGVDAKVRVEYQTRLDPANERPRATRYNEELEDLTGEALDAGELDLPLDPLTQFAHEWRNYTGYSLRIVRLADPAARRIPGQSYNRPCFELENLSDTPFDPVNLIGTIQLINGNSGGVFRIWLCDESGAPISEARLDRLVIADPPKQFGRTVYNERSEHDSYYRQPSGLNRETPAPPHEKSDMEKQMEQLQFTLLSNAIQRAANPAPAPVPPTDATAGMNDEDRLTLLLVKQGGVLPGIVQRVAQLTGSPDAAVAKESWQERGINALLHIAETNPAIVDRLSGTIERIITRVLPDPRAPVVTAPHLEPQPQPQPQPHQIQPQAAAPTGLPEAPNPDDDDTDDIDDDVMDIIEQLFTLLSDTETITGHEPVFAELNKLYPQKFTGVVRLIATVPLDNLIEYIKDQSPLYTALLDSPVTGAHYRARLSELQILCRTPPQPQPQPQPQPNAETNTATEAPETPEAPAS